jgi:hypothetical protein
MIYLSLFLGLCSSAVPLAQGEPPPSQVLILMNEATVLGRFERQPDGSVKRLDGVGTLYPKRQVAKLCDSLEEAYLCLRSRANLRDAHERCRLAQWCLKHGLPNFARVEAQAAVELMPGLAEARQLLAQANQALRANAATPAATAPMHPTPPKPAAPEPTMPASLSEIDQRGSSALATSPFLTWEHLLQPAELQEFTRSIQPILINGCGSGACHGNAEHQAAGFYLLRGLDGRLTADQTRANLAQVLKLVDKQKPSHSPLLRHSVVPHGGRSRLPFGQADAPAVQVLTAWVRRIAPEPQTARPEEPFMPPPRPTTPTEPTFASSGDAGTGPTAVAAPLTGTEPKKAAGSEPQPMPEAPAAPAGPRAMPALMSFRGQVVSGPGAAVPPTAPAAAPAQTPPTPEDPFDPMIFNRVHHPGRG